MWHSSSAQVWQTRWDGGEGYQSIFLRRGYPVYLWDGPRVGRANWSCEEIDYKPRLGVLAPADNTRTTHVTFAEVPLGKSLVVYSGMHDYYARKNSDALVNLHVTIDGKEQLGVRVGNEDRWHRFEIDTSAFAGARHDVRFDIAAVGNPQWRNLGFHAEARR